MLGGEKLEERPGNGIFESLGRAEESKGRDRGSEVGNNFKSLL